MILGYARVSLEEQNLNLQLKTHDYNRLIGSKLLSKWGKNVLAILFLPLALGTPS